MDASTNYYENLRNLLKAKLDISTANSLASRLTKTAKDKELEAYKKEVQEMLKKNKLY